VTWAHAGSGSTFGGGHFNNRDPKDSVAAHNALHQEFSIQISALADDCPAVRCQTAAGFTHSSSSLDIIVRSTTRVARSVKPSL
jgi:hypothetical protein